VGLKEDLLENTLTAKELNWLGDSPIPAEGLKCRARLRSAHVGLPATIYPLEGDRVNVILDEPYNGITPGQACVFYDGTRVLGGAWITRS